MTILKKSGMITEKDHQTNLVIPFSVSPKATELTVRYSYHPKTVEDRKKALELLSDCAEKYEVNADDLSALLPVNNLVTLSFDDPDGYRGACHRQANEQIIMIGEHSTPGILNRKIISGQWDVVLNIHFAGCPINYSVEIAEVRQ